MRTSHRLYDQVREWFGLPPGQPLFSEGTWLRECTVAGRRQQLLAAVTVELRLNGAGIFMFEGSLNHLV